MILTHPPFYIAPLLTSSLLPFLLPSVAPGSSFRTWVLTFAPFSLAFCCSWELLQDLGSDHLPILLSVPLSSVYRSNERPPSFNFQKARWDGFASYFDSHCPSAEEYSSLSSAAALYLSGTKCGQIFYSFRPHQTPS